MHRTTTATEARLAAARVLGIAPDASDAEARAAWRAAARRTHPDVAGGSAEAFVAAKQAWTTWQRTAPVAAPAASRADHTSRVVNPTRHVHTARIVNDRAHAAYAANGTRLGIHADLAA